MKFKLLVIVVLGAMLSSKFVFAQQYDGFKGQGVYQPYDKTYISPSLRGKHGVSIGFGAANVSPQQTFEPQYGAHIGYNYIIMYKRKRFFGIKEVIRDEVKMGFGAHLHWWGNNEWFLNLTYLNPLISLRGKIISLYFFNEFGIGLHRSPPKLEKDSQTKFNVGLEPLRIRFGKSPLNLCVTGYYNLGSALLSKDRMDITSTLTLRYYIYRKK